MPRCPNCNYSLVLLEHRRKYKCAKCSKLFPQMEIEDKEFREWNKKRRVDARKNNLKEYRREYAKKNKDKIKKYAGKYRIKNRDKILARERKRRAKLTEEEREEKRRKEREWNKKNRDRNNRKRREYWAKNRERLCKKRRENYQKQKSQILEEQKVYQENNKVLSRIKHLRNQQKLLALRTLEFNYIKAINSKFQSLLLTS